MKNTYKAEIVFGVMSVICLAVLLNLRWQQSPTISQLVERGQARILEQKPVELELTIDLSDLPEDLELDNHDKDWAIPVYETGTTTICLKSISTSNESEDQLYVAFELRYHDLPDEGEVVGIDEIGPWSDEWASGAGYIGVSETVRDAERAYEDAASIRGYGPGEQVWYYLDADVLGQARENITFRAIFTQMEYEKL